MCVYIITCMYMYMYICVRGVHVSYMCVCECVSVCVCMCCTCEWCTREERGSVCVSESKLVLLGTTVTSII